MEHPEDLEEFVARDVVEDAAGESWNRPIPQARELSRHFVPGAVGQQSGESGERLLERSEKTGSGLDTLRGGKCQRCPAGRSFRSVGRRAVTDLCPAPIHATQHQR